MQEVKRKPQKSPKQTSTQTKVSEKKPSPSQKANTKSSSHQDNKSPQNKSIADLIIDSFKGKKEPVSKKGSSSNAATKRTKPSKNAKSSSSASSHKTSKNYYTQDLIGIKQVIGGMVCLDNGQVIFIQEIIPLNFYQKSVLERNTIYETYKGLFKIAPESLHIKMHTERADVNKVIESVKAANNEESGRILYEMKDYLTHIRSLQASDSYCKKFYLIWEYEGDEDGRKSNNINEIYNTMITTRNNIIGVFDAIGNIPIVPADPNIATCEMLYKFFNPKSSETESFQERLRRLKKDEYSYNNNLVENKKRYYAEEDFIAPRGIKRKRFGNYIVMDGIYHTYVSITDNGYPPLVNTAWVDILCLGLGYDIDIYLKKLPHDTTVSAIEQSNRIGRVYASNKVHNPEKFRELSIDSNNRSFITTRMREMDEDLWNCFTMITIRGNSYQDMLQKKAALVSSLKSRSIYTTDAFLTAMRYFKTSLPFIDYDRSLFNQNKRNMLTSSAASLYNFTSYELFDDNGIVMGRNVRNNSLLSINIFNTQMYANANVSIIGTPGAGKTFTEIMMARRLRLSGMRTFFVLPVKGYEYYNHINAMNGEIVKLFPGSNTCINIMQIRPEIKIDKDSLANDIDVEDKSLLAKKITSIEVFLQLLMQDRRFNVQELNRLNKIITKVYSRFDITDDNNSIYRDKKLGILKEMPTLQDLYIGLKADDMMRDTAEVLVPFTDGSFQNFNAQTNISLTNKCIAFDVDEEMVGEMFLPAIMYIAFDCAYDIVKQDKLSKDVIFLDEAWVMTQNEECAKQVQKMIKLIRGYGGGITIASQNLDDFINGENRYGRAVISNTEIKIILKIKKDQIRDVAQIIDLTNEDIVNLSKMKRGYGLIYSNGDKIFTRFDASEREIEIATTDINVKKQILQRKKKKKHAVS